MVQQYINNNKRWMTKECYARAARVRQEWAKADGIALQERVSRSINRAHRHYDETTGELNFNDVFLSSFASQHPALAAFVDGARLLCQPADDLEKQILGWRMLKAAWNVYYKECGDGDLACLHFTDACAAAGATVSERGRSAPNCVHFALGAYIGAPEHTSVADVLNRALVGCIRRRQDGGNESVMTTLWPELLRDLGFALARQPIVGDLIVYTICKQSWHAAAAAELAVHFGRLVSVEQQLGLLVESKSGYAFHTYVHPLSVVDPTYLIEAPRMRVHCFRALRPPLSLPHLSALASHYKERLRVEYGV